MNKKTDWGVAFFWWSSGLCGGVLGTWIAQTFFS